MRLFHQNRQTANRGREGAEQPQTLDASRASHHEERAVSLIRADIPLLTPTAVALPAWFLEQAVLDMGQVASLIDAEILIADISASSAFLTAARYRMQAVVNIAMGASLSAVALTVPAMGAIARFTNRPSSWP
jgi:Ca2+:H+ antiporter